MTDQTQEPGSIGQPFYSIKHICDEFDCGTTKAYRLINEGVDIEINGKTENFKLEKIKFGGTTVITGRSRDRLYNALSGVTNGEASA